MKYALLLMGHVNDPACGEEDGPSPEEFFAFDEVITQAGVVVTSFALEDFSEGVVTVSSNAEGERIVSSGPFAEVADFVGGGYIIEVATIDEAIEWARRSPGSKPGGHVEIRPVAPY